jgi:hypothetical protein
MLGEDLFLLTQTMHSNLAGKITGMLLDIDNSELQHMFKSPKSLHSKVDETVVDQQAHHATKEAAQKVGTVAATSQMRKSPSQKLNDPLMEFNSRFEDFYHVLRTSTPRPISHTHPILSSTQVVVILVLRIEPRTSYLIDKCSN